jgi:hypothetical protein
MIEMKTKNETARDKIERGGWVNCYICETVFARKRETKRYCRHCEKGYCEGEHGTFRGNNSHCIVCDTDLNPNKKS